MPDESVHCVVTSPPYWGLRDYGVVGQMGMEPTLGEHIANMVTLFREVRRVLRSDGTFWLNYGDCYATSPNGRSAAATKEAGNDDRTFRDKPFSTIGPIYRNKREGGRWGGGNNSDPTLKAKDLVMMPNRVAIALQEDGWWVRSEIIWHKPNPMPESIRDRPGTAHEKIFLLTKSKRYFYDADAVRVPAAASSLQRWAQDVDSQDGSTRQPGETNGPMKAVGGPRSSDRQRGHSRRHAGFNDRWDQKDRSEEGAQGRNLRNVWTVSPKGFKGAHFATFPPDLIKPCILAGCPVGGTVLDPFIGAGTTALVAEELGRNSIGLELNPEYLALARGRLDAARSERHAAWLAATAQYDLFAARQAAE